MNQSRTAYEINSLQRRSVEVNGGGKHVRFINNYNMWRNLIDCIGKTVVFFLQNTFFLPRKKTKMPHNYFSSQWIIFEAVHWNKAFERIDSLKWIPNAAKEWSADLEFIFRPVGGAVSVVYCILGKIPIVQIILNTLLLCHLLRKCT